jgi:hypothetical protein
MDGLDVNVVAFARRRVGDVICETSMLTDARAKACLALVLMKEDLPFSMRDSYGMALERMLEAASAADSRTQEDQAQTAPCEDTKDT